MKVAGKIVSDMCRAAARSRPEITLSKLLPYVSNCVKNLASGKLKTFVVYDWCDFTT